MNYSLREKKNMTVKYLSVKGKCYYSRLNRVEKAGDNELP